MSNPIEDLLAGVVKDGMVATDSGDGRGIVMLPVADLQLTAGASDDAGETASWIEFRRPGTDTVIHRSAHVALKQGIGAVGQAGTVGG